MQLTDPSSRSAHKARPRTRARWFTKFIATFLASFTLVAVFAAPSQADGIERRVQGTLLNRDAGDQPVAGVKFTVTSSTGETYEATTDDSGRYLIKIPATDEGTLTVALDEATLPSDAKLAPGVSAEKELAASGVTIQSFSPAIGADNRQVETKWDQVPQTIYNGLVFGIILSLAALGLSMVFGTTGLTNFAHGELVTFGAVVTYFFNRTIGAPIAIAILVTVLLSAGFGWLNDRGLWAPLRRRGTGLIAMMIVSIGLQFLLRNIYQYFTGGRALTYREGVTPTPHTFAGVDYTSRDLILVGISLVGLLGVTLFLQYSRLGRATRAVADNPALAASTGINVNRVISAVWIVGTALAGLGGAFLGFSQSVTFQLGAQVLLLIFAATCVGGLGSIWGAMLGSVVIGLFVELSTLVIPTQLKYAGAMVLLILVLLIRPQGILGRQQRIG